MTIERSPVGHVRRQQRLAFNHTSVTVAFLLFERQQFEPVFGFVFDQPRVDRFAQPFLIGFHDAAVCFAALDSQLVRRNAQPVSERRQTELPRFDQLRLCRVDR